MSFLAVNPSRFLALPSGPPPGQARANSHNPTADVMGLLREIRLKVEREVSLHFKHNILVTNPLSFAWNNVEIKRNPKIILAGLALYPLGMVGYAWDLLTRISFFVAALFDFVGEFFSQLFNGNPKFKENQVFQERLLILGGTTGELVSGIVGCVCPPVAYKMDEWIQSNPTIYQHYYNSNPFIPHALWSRPEEFQYKPLLQCCTQARKRFQEFIKRDYLDSNDAGLLISLACGGILFAFHKGLDLMKIREKFLDNVEKQADTDATLAVEKDLKPSIQEEMERDEQLQTKLKQLRNDATKETYKNELSLRAYEKLIDRGMPSLNDQESEILIAEIIQEMGDDQDFQSRLTELGNNAVNKECDLELGKRVSARLKTADGRKKIAEKKVAIIEAAKKNIISSLAGFNEKIKILTEQNSLQRQRILELLIKKIVLECRSADAAATDEEFFIQASQKNDLNKEFAELDKNAQVLIHQIYMDLKTYTDQFIYKERPFLQIMGDYI